MAEKSHLNQCNEIGESFDITVDNNFLNVRGKELIDILNSENTVKGKVFFVRPGTTKAEEERNQKIGKGEVVGTLTQIADTSLGEIGKNQIWITANKLKPFLTGKVIFVYPQDGEKQGDLGGHERINESLYLFFFLTFFHFFLELLVNNSSVFIIN